MVSPNLTNATVEACAATCQQKGLPFAVIQSKPQYECFIKMSPDGHRTPIWTRMEVTLNGIFDAVANKNLSNFAASTVLARGPYNTIPTTNGTVTGPIYLYNRHYILTNDTHGLPNSQCACGPGKLYSIQCHELL